MTEHFPVQANLVDDDHVGTRGAFRDFTGKADAVQGQIRELRAQRGDIDIARPDGIEIQEYRLHGREGSA